MFGFGGIISVPGMIYMSYKNVQVVKILESSIAYSWVEPMAWTTTMKKNQIPAAKATPKSQLDDSWVPSTKLPTASRGRSRVGKVDDMLDARIRGKYECKEHQSEYICGLFRPVPTSEAKENHCWNMA